MAQGLKNREVAAALFLSPKTVEHHLGAVLRKRGLRSRTELARALAVDPAATGSRVGLSRGDGNWVHALVQTEKSGELGLHHVQLDRHVVGRAKIEVVTRVGLDDR